MQDNEKLEQQIRSFKGYVFDMDGTLVNSEPRHHDSWYHVAREHGIEGLTEEMLDSFGGLPSRVICERFNELLNSNIDPETLGREKAEAYRKFYMEKAEPFEKIIALLKELKASGKRIALATSSERVEALYFMNKFGVLPYIDSIISGEMVKNGKPNPDIYLMAVASLNLQPEDCLVFEDTVVGMQGVKNANMTAIKVFNGEYQCTAPILASDPWEGRD